MTRFFMVLNPLTGYTKYQHSTYGQAKDEAIRLAREYPNAEFIILGAIARVKKQDIVIDEIEAAEDIPF